MAAIAHHSLLEDEYTMLHVCVSVVLPDLASCPDSCSMRSVQMTWTNPARPTWGNSFTVHNHSLSMMTSQVSSVCGQTCNRKGAPALLTL